MSKQLFFLVMTTFLQASFGFATETRVDSTGGLTLVLTDESTEINPFLFGNPAGLALLLPQTRFDLVGQWFKETSNSTNITSNVYATLNRLGDDTPHYHGLMAFLSPQWAVQLDGDFAQSENSPDILITDQTRTRTRELLRTAYNFGPFVLGVQAQPIQLNLTVKPQSLSGGAQLLSGQGTGSAFVGTAGLLACFPGETNPKGTSLKIGGTASTELTPGQEIQNLAFQLSGGFNVGVTETYTSSNVLTWGPEIYFEDSENFQSFLFGRFSNGSLSFQQDSSNTALVTNEPSFKAQDTNSAVGIAAFKMKSPLSHSDAIKSGFLFAFSSTNQNNYDSAGTTATTSNTQGWTTLAGIGLEGKKDYTVGLQFQLQGSNSANTLTTPPNPTINFFSYKVALGGERWLSPQWAFRMGLAYQNDYNSGIQAYQQPLYSVASGNRIITTTITAGAGFREKSFLADLMFLTGQPSLDNSSSPNDFGLLLSVQLAASILFN
jgi:hypothetical protein